MQEGAKDHANDEALGETEAHEGGEKADEQICFVVSDVLHKSHDAQALKKEEDAENGEGEDAEEFRKGAVKE